MLVIVIVFFCLSILLYLLLGGADYGVGILEIFTHKDLKPRTRKATYKIIGPVWEANHMWLIIAIVILFVGFPAIYTTLSTYLHIPLVLMLLGIIGRGTAFVFRHYDAVEDGMHRVYHLIFAYSSLVTPFFLGIIAASMIAGNIDPTATSFTDLFIHPWLSVFPVSVGLFTVCICGFLASVYLSGETMDEDLTAFFIKHAKRFNIYTVLTGAMVLLSSYFNSVSLAQDIWTNPVVIGTFIIATLLLIPLWLNLGKNDRKLIIRLIAGAEIALILFGLGYSYFPDIIILKNAPNLSLLAHASSPGTITVLAWGLMIGSLFILPSLFYLIYSFQSKPASYTH